MMTAYQGSAFHEFCTIGGTCIGAYGNVTHLVGEFAKIGGGGGGSSAGFADLQGFADYSFASQRWGETCGNIKHCKENWWQVSWALDHEILDPEWSATALREIQFGRLRGDYESEDYNAITPMKTEGKYQAGYVFLNQKSDVWSSDDPTALAWLIVHELSHSEAFRLGLIGPDDSKAEILAEETRANCVAGRAVGRTHSELNSVGGHRCH
jgi:hypothetical protein